MRVIVTGTRAWHEPDRVWHELDRVVSELHFPETIVVVHGAAPKGAEKAAADWVEARGNPECMHGNASLIAEAHPADWGRDARAAAFKRNLRMAQLGADLCLAFWNGRCSSTEDMIYLALQHGIDVRIFPQAAQERSSGVPDSER